MVQLGGDVCSRGGKRHLERRSRATLHPDSQARQRSECQGEGPSLPEGQGIPLDGGRRVQTAARWQDGGGTQDGGPGEHRSGNSSGDGSLWRPEGAGPPPAELLLARHGGHCRTHHQGVLVVRSSESWVSGVREGTPASSNPRYGLSIGGRFRGSPSQNTKGQHMDPCVHRAFQ